MRRSRFPRERPPPGSGGPRRPSGSRPFPPSPEASHASRRSYAQAAGTAAKSRSCDRPASCGQFRLYTRSLRKIRDFPAKADCGSSSPPVRTSYTREWPSSGRCSRDGLLQAVVPAMAFFRPLFPRWPSSGRHSRASGNPLQSRKSLDSRLRGNDESGRDARAPRTLGSRFRGNDEGGRTACDPRTPAADLRDRRLPTDPPDDSHPPDPTERLQVAVPSLDSTSSARVSLGVARSCRMSRETSSTGRPHRQQPSPKHPTLIEGATAPPPTARQSHHPERPIINISCRSWRVAAPWILNALKKLAKFLHRDSPSVDRGAELDGFTSSWVSAKS